MFKNCIAQIPFLIHKDQDLLTGPSYNFWTPPSPPSYQLCACPLIFRQINYYLFLLKRLSLFRLRNFLGRALWPGRVLIFNNLKQIYFELGYVKTLSGPSTADISLKGLKKLSLHIPIVTGH